ncbi:MAG: hypothetical protein AVDCRST_MAG87-724 [uncultured Thermomicrobiales bacterium]|uniref:Uncharacterized protein n=1 Tax=uncultured Thermomicrobiales bacterium TaxID=1645740 RepID=A0A6J4UJI8_9BACT|nr:MAG: hypothetical protein AVDCRST_MAG87-724 [uncultured Thermomicrobiales bacterium]
MFPPAAFPAIRVENGCWQRDSMCHIANVTRALREKESGGGPPCMFGEVDRGGVRAGLADP